jgi:hypothetical protein
VRAVAALVAITVVLLAGPLPGVASAGEAVVPGTVPADTGRADPTAAATGPLRLDLTRVEPRVVTAGGPDTLTVVGTLTNTGSTPVDDLVIRVQRGDALRTEGQVRDALDGSAATDTVTPQFTGLPGPLAPGAGVAVQLAVPLRGAPQTSLALSGTGVYELLVNVNGVPQGGDRARLAADRMLLPVVSLPPGPQGAAAVAADRAVATPISLLFPITDVPHRLSTVPGEPTLLTDDDLAASLAPDGRLGGLLAALTATAPRGSAVRQSICLAVDPDLVETVAAMRDGYNVRGPDGNPVPGAGAQVAAAWLESLVTVAGDGCTTALPYADADLVALTRGGQGALATGAIIQGRQTLTDVLGVPVVDDVTWPAGGLLDVPTLDAVAQAGGSTVVLAADGVEQPRTARTTGVVPLETTKAGDQQTAVLTDPLLSTALAGPTAATDATGARGAAAATSSPAGGGGPLATQDGIGALVFRVQDGDQTKGGPLVLAPPQAWGADGAAAQALLEAVDQLVSTGVVRPRGSDAVAPAAPVAPTAPVALAYPLETGDGEVPQPVVDTIARTAAAVADLRSAAKPGSPVGVSPDAAFAPLERGLVRPASAVFRDHDADAVRAAQAAAARVDELRGSVRVLEPPSPYSLGTENAPILITVANDLPVTMEVQVEITPSPGLRVAPIPPQQIPPLGRRQLSASADVTRAGQFTVQASVRTPAGQLLGPPSRLRMRSTAYGTISLWLTGSAGVLLVVLAARRVVRRIRGVAPQRREIALGPRPGSTPGSPPDPTSTAAPPDPPTTGDPPNDHRTGDPFPDPAPTTERLPTTEVTERLPTTEATERLPAARPRPRPPEPPRVGSR